MGKSSDSTEGKFQSFRGARAEEWLWLVIILGLAMGHRALIQWQWKRSLASMPDVGVSDLLCWAETFPPVESQWPKQSLRSNPRPRVSNNWNNGTRSESWKRDSWVDAEHLELNQADSASLEALPGIGPVLARRVVRFRDSMRGFSDLESLYMVYGLDSSVVDSLKARCTLDAGLVRPFCLDSIDFSTLLKHPLWDYEGAQCVMRARGHGVASMAELWTRMRTMGCHQDRWMPYLQLCEVHVDSVQVH